MFALFGGSFFWLYMGPERWAGGPAGLPWSIRRTTQLIRIAAPIAALSGLVWLDATIANMTGAFAGVVDPTTLHAFFFETAFGPLAVARLILLAAVVAFAILPMRARLRFAAVAVASALLLVSQAWLGHAAEGGDTLYGTAMIVAYAAHVLAGAAWVGGLPPLLLAIVEQRRRGYSDPRAGTLRLLSRYSAMAVLAVSVIVLSGIANTAFRVGLAFGALAPTAYGKVLFVKLGIVTVMLALAAFNRFAMMPRLRLAPSASPIWLFALRASIALEGALGLAVLGAAAVLGITPPPF